MRSIPLILVMMAAWCGLILPARATTVIPPDFATMVKQAEVIFRGQVTDVRSEWTGQGSDRCIVSYVTFTVQKTLKGSAPSPYVLKMLGGTVGDQAMEIDGVPKFKTGDRTLLFVEHNGTQFFPVVGIMHGYFRIQTDAKTGEETVLKYDGQPLRSTAEIDQAHQLAVATSGVMTAESTSSGTPMKRSDFEDEIQRKLSAGH